jgi:hypothetical protein
LTEVVTDEVNGLLFEPGDAVGLAACIERLAANPALLSDLRAGAEGTVLLSQGEHVRALLSLYRQVVEGPRSSEEQRIVLDRLHHECLRAGFARTRRLLRSSVGPP